MDREKALDLALAQIEKQHGRGAIMRMGDRVSQNVAVIPTGAIGLDVALGVGGLPRGRVVEIFGPESSGKCAVAGTYVWTDLGLETIEELFARVGQPATCTTRETDVREHGVRLVNGHGELELMAAVTHNNNKPTWRITVQSGRSVTVTAGHPLRVLNENAEAVWRPVSDLRTGDVLVSATFGADEANGCHGLSVDEASLLGYLVAEGWVASRKTFEFTNSHDADVVAEYYRLFETVLGIPPHRVKSYGTPHHRIHDVRARRRLAEEFGLDYCLAPDKQVPLTVRTSGAKAQRAFLSALFEGDGWIQRGPEVALATASKTLGEQVQLLLLGLGIPCSLTSKWNATYERDYWTVRIPPGAVARFLDAVGFRSARRAEQVRRHLRPTKPGTNWEAVPFVTPLVRDLRDALGGDRDLDRLYHDLTRSDLCAMGAIEASRQRLKAIVAWADARFVPPHSRPLVERLRFFADAPYTYERITAIEDAGLQPTFDVVLPKTHSFLANGIVSHNTSLALHAIAEAQKLGGIAAFIDAEHALDPTYASNLGVDVEALLVSQPDTGEQALEIVDTLVRSGAMDIIVIDSVAALTPRAEIEGEMGDTHVGLQARLMSQALRKLAGHLNRSRTCCVFINQLREKIGVLFGCMAGTQRVTLANGSTETIGRIVRNRLPVDVLSYDEASGALVSRRVVDWYDNGPTEDFLHITVGASGPRGQSQNTIVCTENHPFMTHRGWVEAGHLLDDDKVVRAVTHRLSDQQWEVVLGGLMGDSALSWNTNRLAARLRWGHGSKQVEYADWKASLLGNIPVSRTTNAKGAIFHDFMPLPELRNLREAVYIAGRKVLSWDYLKQLTPLSLGIWYCDDGHFSFRSKGLQQRTIGRTGRSEICVQAFEPSSQRRLQEHLADTWALEAHLGERGGNTFLTFPVAQTDRLHALIAPYVPPCMDYKLLPSYRGRFSVSPHFIEPHYQASDYPIRRIERRLAAPGKAHRFDIQVEGTHNYFVDGVMVHNSPETTPGGRALKFYSSVRLDVRRIESLKDGTDFVGNRVRVKVVKNKVSAPFRQTEFDILFGKGISKEGSLLDLGVEHGIVRKSGAWFTYEGEQLGQGRENARSFLKEHDDTAAEIYKKITELLGISPSDVGGAGDEIPPLVE